MVAGESGQLYAVEGKIYLARNASSTFFQMPGEIGSVKCKFTAISTSPATIEFARIPRDEKSRARRKLTAQHPKEDVQDPRTTTGPTTRRISASSRKMESYSDCAVHVPLLLASESPRKSLSFSELTFKTSRWKYVELLPLLRPHAPKTTALLPHQPACVRPGRDDA